jgi:hypothetical protein
MDGGRNFGKTAPASAMPIPQTLAAASDAKAFAITCRPGNANSSRVPGLT